MLRPGFGPGSSARKADMLGRTTPPERGHRIKIIVINPYRFPNFNTFPEDHHSMFRNVISFSVIIPVDVQ